MLYVFYVDIGTMMTFDMNLALESVEQLKEVIARTCLIPADKQVMLVSGGVSLEPTARVCSYSAGTDTNPIYLFNLKSIESLTPPSLSFDYGSDMALKDQVDGSRSLPDTYKTLVARVQLAQQFCELAREQTRICESLVHDQHLQQQGWAVVLANLGDIEEAFNDGAKLFYQSFNKHLETRAEFLSLLQNFYGDLDILSKIPIVPALQSNAKSLVHNLDGSTSQADMAQSTEGGAEGDSLPSHSEPWTLLKWISSFDRHRSPEEVAVQCLRGLEMFDSKMAEAMKVEIEKVQTEATRLDMKEIKGLEERLSGLEKLMFQTKRIVQEQGDLAQSFLQNQTRASNLGDPSILPDLCASHRGQLLVMLHNHERLLDIRARCTRAKDELCSNLHERLKWITYVQNNMRDVGIRILMHHENLKRLRQHLDYVQQIHLAPQMYVTAVGEVVRRRTFSQAFLVWASDLACQLLAVHNEEVARRRNFQCQFDGHFLNELFPGMEDYPPPFATQAPPIFDSKLPKLTVEDGERLRLILPELTFSLSIPDLETITQFFLVKSVTGTLKSEDKEGVAPLEEHMVKVIADACLTLEPVLLEPADTSQNPSATSGLQPPRDQEKLVWCKLNNSKSCESETDTEEFEKVGQSPLELEGGRQPEEDPTSTLEVGVGTLALSPSSPHSHTTQHHPEFVTADFYIDESMPSSYSDSNGSKCHHHAVMDLQRQLEDIHTLVALLQENLGNTRTEVEQLRGLLQTVGRVALDVVTGMRAELTALRTQMCSEQQATTVLYRQLVAALATLDEQRAKVDSRHREVVLRLGVDHQLELENMKHSTREAADAREQHISTLQQRVEEQEVELATLRANMELRLEEEVKARQDVAQRLASELDGARQLCGELQERLEAAELEKTQALKEQADRLTHTYKTDLEGLRSRFRLMATTSMERSPSDSSLEKIERMDLIELVNHEAIVTQLRETLSEERETAVQTALEQERAAWGAKLEQELKAVKSRSEAEKQVWFNEAMRKVVAEKGRQLDALRARENILVEECRKHQHTIHGLTSDGDQSTSRSLGSEGAAMWPLLDRVDALEADKALLQAQLVEERSRRLAEDRAGPSVTDDGDDKTHTAFADMSTSVAVLPESGSRDAATSPDPSHRHMQDDHTVKDKLSRSTTSLIQQWKLSIEQCNVGDAVLVVWDESHHNYKIYQETSMLYFLHSDCLTTLALQTSSEGSPRQQYSTGEVIEKEFCHAKKPQNRYQVPKGTKFYRVKLRPLRREQTLSRSQHHQHRSVEGPSK